ncbi:hypothetical protein DPMN_099452 [Dreissena polymorpha]|uniref:Uncharacterized protein n=1 Tax=Dreissena polymorpha TaxID=45954 RepID=A0A9D4LGG4_DREPO|nr:hypothetical protein DPMN_099452 [Dreissena polymorpha]
MNMHKAHFCQYVAQNVLPNTGPTSSVVVRRDKEVSEGDQLVVGKHQLVVVPAVMVGTTEIGQRLLDCRLKKRKRAIKLSTLEPRFEHSKTPVF